ncbi:hypothetical protein Tco_0006176 [Tanacetum coccineum]
MTETMEQYMSKTRGDYGSDVTRPTINQDTHFELKGQFFKEIHDNTFSGSEHEDLNEHIEKVLEIVGLFHIPKITQDQIMLRAFHVSLTRAASRWLRNQPSGSITTWEVLETKFQNKYCPPARTTKNGGNQQLPGAIPSKTAVDAKITIQEMAEYSKKWHNRTSSRTKSTETYDGLAAIQAQLNNLGREIKKVNKKVYAAQFDAPYQPRGQYRAVWPRFYQQNNRNSSYPDRRPSLQESLTKFMAESVKRHEENSNIIKEIRASTDAAIRNQGASIKTLEIQIGQMSKIRRIECGPYVVSGTQHKSVFSKTVPFPRRLQNFGCDDWREAQDVKILVAYNHTLPLKEKDPGSFTLPCFIHNICFDKALVDLGASFTIIDSDDIIKDAVLGMKFCKKYASCQMIMKKFTHGDEHERIIDE